MAPSPAESPSPSGGGLGCSFRARTKGSGEPLASARRRASPGGSGRRSLPCQLHSPAEPRAGSPWHPAPEAPRPRPAATPPRVTAVGSQARGARRRRWEEHPPAPGDS